MCDFICIEKNGVLYEVGISDWGVWGYNEVNLRMVKLRNVICLRGEVWK